MAGRKKAIGIAYLATVLAKGFGFAVQLALIPVAARALGQEALGFLFSLAALLSFPLIGVAGFSPAASFMMSGASGAKDDRAFGDAFWFLFFTGLAVGLVFAVILPFLLPSLDPGSGIAGLTDAELTQISLLSALYLFAGYACSMTDGVRAALRESHYTNIFAMLGSAIMLAMAIWIWTHGGDIITIFVAIYLVPMFVQCANLALSYLQHRARLGRPRWQSSAARTGKGILLGNVEAQSGMVFYLHGGTYLIGQLAGLPAAAIVGTIGRVAIQMHSFTVAFFNPVLAMVSEGRASGDDLWLKTVIQKLGLLAALFVGGLFFVIALQGRLLSRLLMGEAYDGSAYFYPALALFLLVYSATHLLYLTRLATGLAKRRGTRILFAAILGLVICTFVMGASVTMFLIILAVPMLLLATLPYLRDVARLMSPGQATKYDERETG